MKILVSGGAGYIGSHTVVQLVAAGYDVVIVDNFSNSHPTVTGRLEALTGTRIALHSFDLTDHDKTEHLFATEHFDGVIHFAGHKAVGESVEKPLEYYENNLVSTFALVRAMQRYDVDKLVFSSSATVYGEDQAAATEDRRTYATNPYGWTKVMQEQILRDVAIARPRMRFALLRYFNPVGAHPSGTIGEDPSGIPNNLVPYIAQVAVGKREKLMVFGGDYDTVDGTGVRDYIHVEDLAAGHIAALKALGTPTRRSTPGTSAPATARACSRWCARSRRPSAASCPTRSSTAVAGDVATSYADPSKANRELGWSTVKTVDDMAADTWRWQSQNPRGLRRLMRRRAAVVVLLLPLLGVSEDVAVARTPDPRPSRPQVSAEALAGRVVVIDPGHQLGNHNFPRRINRPVPAGGFTKPCNTTGTATDGGYPEATFAWQVSRLVAARLRELGATVRLTRHEQPSGPLGSVRRRARPGRERHLAPGADLKLSIHADGSYAAGARGFHVIAPPDRAPWTADIHRPSMRLATSVKAGLLSERFGVATYTAGGDGIDVRSDLGTLNLSDVPTVMVELGNMRSTSEARVMTSPSGRARYARGLVSGVRRFLG